MVRREAESAVRPELVPGVVLPVASGPGLPAWRFNNSTEWHCNAEYWFATSLADRARKSEATEGHCQTNDNQVEFVILAFP